MAHNRQHRMLQNCPYLRANHKECYCVDITSSKVSDAIKYCGTNYLDCPVLKTLTGYKRNQVAARQQQQS